MSWIHWLKKSVSMPSRKGLPTGKTKTAWSRLFLERLEDRIVPTNWMGTIPDGTVWTNAQVQNIVGDIDVPQGATLTIQPGTVVQFNGGTSLTVEGTVNATGTAAQHIYFTSYRDNSPLAGANTAGNGDWDKFEFNSGSTNNVLDFVEVRVRWRRRSTGRRRR